MSTVRLVTLITGASAGIGAAFADTLAERGHHLVLVARRGERLEALAERLRGLYGARVDWVALDLAEPGAAERLIAWCDEREFSIDWLINNAGLGMPGRLHDSDWREHAACLRLMVEAPTELVARALPMMRRRGCGTVINVASLAAYLPGTEGHTLYAGIKAYLLRFSESLALENRAAGVRVCALCPGLTLSEFHDVTGTRELMAKLPGFMWQRADQVVEAALDGLAHDRTIVVPGRFNRLTKRLARLIPERLALWLAARESKRYRQL
ncbi:SDR family NAD(P)-dependent oxidoreductase [Halotalea alkalilenta]|uniref:Dehydrogenase n=1 Tax=Halotalea alkalilenta TaxID=376489 RepID=A0A172YCE9_9GAMM|nr:SDR family oxidoreductase [Halotalea alkalilenta]ANF56894.1 dehydrogenase [Halotalea alkalilenta]